MTDKACLETAMTEVAGRIEKTLAALLPKGDGPEARVFAAMAYAALDGGKRLRPFLTVQTARLFDVPDSRSLRAGAAIEFVHCYSLVHDDLPAMDDDDLRRGRPSNHIEFDEAIAILAGDALQTLAFEVLADPATHPDGNVRADLVAALASAAGAQGMVGGQMFDIAAETAGAGFTLEQITRLQRMKTGRLFEAACEAGAILGGASPGGTGGAGGLHRRPRPRLPDCRRHSGRDRRCRGSRQDGRQGRCRRKSDLHFDPGAGFRPGAGQYACIAGS